MKTEPEQIGTFSILSHYAERVFHTTKRNIRFLFATVLIVSGLFFLYNYTQVPPPPLNKPPIETSSCTLGALLERSGCNEPTFFLESSAYLETKGYVDANGFLFTPTKTEPPFVFANLNNGVVSVNVNQQGSFAPIETVIFKNILSTRCVDEPKPLVVDVGGNMGYFSTYAGKIGCRVNAYEPVPSPRRFIYFNTMINKLNSLVKIYPYAVGINRTVVGIDVNPDWGLSMISPEGALKVETVTSEDVINENVLLLKIDTEGHESKVLHGVLDLLKKFSIENFIVETKPIEVDWMRGFINEMAKEYHIISYVEEYGAASHNKNLGEISCTNIPSLAVGAWIPNEDLWYIKKGSKTYDKVINSLKCRTA